MNAVPLPSGDTSELSVRKMTADLTGRATLALAFMTTLLV